MIRTDVLVVGGGIMGAATAFFLRRRGISVALVERALIGQQASGVNFGNVRRQGRFLGQLPLAHRSRALWGRLPELVGEDCEFTVTGHVRIARDAAGVQRLTDYAEAARPLGLELELLTPNMLRSRFPFFGPEVTIGSYSPHDGQANPRLVAPAFGRAAARAGAQVFEGTEIVSLTHGSTGFEAETADGQRLSAPVAVVTAGGWADRLSAALGEPVPLELHAPQMAVTEPLPHRITPVIGISTEIQEEGLYIRQVERGNVVFGGGRRGAIVDGRAKAVPSNLLLQLRELQRFLPGTRHARIIRTWAGVESYLPDHLPVIGPSARVPGLHYAFGFCGHGFQLGPGVGDVLAEIIDTGRTDVPLEPFSIARFAAPMP
ncbi:FAD-binding oxidoreductase [Oceanicella sp. SM1341]|uniref:NAD(P)/FAD-dependent oxidoreductase n=1 Tax=Oceanicella sp. SM1341 TaxID=1548889 RepID=UPI000E54F062|nr:FAD-binding oxidoreductase [Oceanicella sp. SM1341]